MADLQEMLKELLISSLEGAGKSVNGSSDNSHGSRSGGSHPGRGLAAGAGLSFFLGLNEREWWKKVVCLALAAMMVHATMFGNSRGGMLGIVMTGIVTLLLIPKKPFELSLIAAATLVGLRLAGPQVWQRFATTFASGEARDASAGSRLQRPHRA